MTANNYDFEQRYSLRKEIEESVILSIILERTDLEKRLTKKALAVLQYVFTEMVNNAIDHSEGKELRISFDANKEAVTFFIEDDGIGLFEKVRNAFNLENTLYAAEKVIEGKTTTDPERHSGEGIFFSSKAVDFFAIEANKLLLEIDNRKSDVDIKESTRSKGTKITFSIPIHTSVVLLDLFAEYTNKTTFAFEKTKILIKLFTVATSFVSRSEARRLLTGLDTKFTYIVLDYKKVEGVGQGFVDEIYRVFKKRHPEIEIESINMNKAVSFMIKRGEAHK